MSILVQLAIFLAVVAGSGAFLVALGSNGITAFTTAGTQLLAAAITGTAITVVVALLAFYIRSVE